MATKTVTLNGAEQQVDELGGLNALIVNNTTEPLYASAKAGVVPYADGVIEIQSGEAQTLPDSNGTVYLLGSGGRAQLTGIVNFKMPSRRSGGGGVTEAEVNGIVTEKIAEVVANAPEDFDTLKEIADWIDGHEDSAAAMNSEIKANAADITDIQTEQETQNTDISALQSGLSQISNPNLLDNPDFKINQRGQSEYSTDMSAQYTYGVDRWKIGRGSKLSIHDGYIRIEAVNDDDPNAYRFICLRPEMNLSNKQVTMSVKARGNGRIRIGRVNSETNQFSLTSDWQTYSYTFNIPLISGNHWRYNFQIAYDEEVGSRGYVEIEWVKLELGDHATTFVPPHPATELLKCQRYYMGGRIKSEKNLANDTYYYIYTPVTMRDIPNYITGGTLYKTGNIPIEAILTPYRLDNGAVVLRSSVAVNEFSWLFFEANEGLSADL